MGGVREGGTGWETRRGVRKGVSEGQARSEDIWEGKMKKGRRGQPLLVALVKMSFLSLYEVSKFPF